MTTLELSCSCGEVRGTADFSRPSRVHVICHCGDCRAYARHLGRDDAREIVQVAPSQLRITHGMDRVRAVRLRGLVRWYAECCKTPIANTARSPRVPFAGLMRTLIVTGDETVFGRAVQANGGRRTPLGVVFRAAWFLVVSFFARRQTPSPFFDARGVIVVEPVQIANRAAETETETETPR
jgi:hypothetical protein